MAKVLILNLVWLCQATKAHYFARKNALEIIKKKAFDDPILELDLLFHTPHYVFPGAISAKYSSSALVQLPSVIE